MAEEGDHADMSHSEDEEEDGEEMSEAAFIEHVISVRSGEFTLPDTVTLIELDNGGKVYIVGTSHFSDESAKDVEFMIEKTCPDSVVLELCKGRSKMLDMDEDTLRREMANFDITSLIRKEGISGGLTYYLMLRMSAYVMESIGRAPGMEFRAAYNRARYLPHCRIFLGDRPVSITFKRAMAFLGLWAKLKFLFALIKDFQPITKEMVEEMKKADLLEQLMKELSSESPELSRVFVTERDEFLTRYIWDVANRLESRGVAGPSVTVAVVGIGHMVGIRRHWDRASEIVKEDLCSIPPVSLPQRALKLTIKMSIAGVLVYGGYSLVCRIARIWA